MNMAFFILFNTLQSTKTVACHVKGGGGIVIKLQ